MNRNVRNVSKEVLSEQWYTLTKYTFDYRARDGEWRTLHRESYDRGNGATVLLYNRKQRTVVLTRQFRMPSYVNGHTDGMLIEACAGLLDGDSPNTCIIREVEEETGYIITNPTHVMEAYMSPGAVTEKIHFFVAEYAPEQRSGQGGGLHAEQEDIEVLELGFDEACAMVTTGAVQDAKTIMLLQYAQVHDLFGDHGNDPD